MYGQFDKFTAIFPKAAYISAGPPKQTEPATVLWSVSYNKNFDDNTISYLDLVSIDDNKESFSLYVKAKKIDQALWAI